MGFWDHLDELRERLIRCAYLFVIGFALCYWKSDVILYWIKKPYFDQLPLDQQKLYYLTLYENFLVHLKVSAWGALVFLSPVYGVFLWGFFSPALHKHEKKLVLPVSFFSASFFLLGVAFAYFFLFPKGVKYFLHYGTFQEVALITLDSYVSVVLKILLGFGICFEMPVVLVLLCRWGVLSSRQLSQGRRYAFMVIAFLSALVAPPDALSMVLLMGPLYILFEIAVLAAKFLEQRNPTQS